MDEGIMEKTPVKEELSKKDLAFLVDLDGVLMNNDEVVGYKETVEKNFLAGPYSHIKKIIQEKTALGNKVDELSEKALEFLWQSWDEIRTQLGYPDPQETAVVTARKLETAGLLSKEKYGTFVGDRPFERSVYGNYAFGAFSPLDPNNLHKEQQQAYDRYSLAQGIWLSFFPREGSDKLLYPGAGEFAQFARDNGKFVIWTEGDEREQTNKIVESEQLTGSREPWVPSNPRFGKSVQEMTKEHVISKDKKVELTALLKGLDAEGYSKIVIIEDKTDNLAFALDKATELGLKDKVIPIWVRQGRHKNTTPESMSLEETAELYNAVDSISQVSEKINQLWLSSSA